MGWVIVGLGIIGVVVSGVLTKKHTYGSPELCVASADRLIPQLVPKWVSLLNIVGFVAILIGIIWVIARLLS